STHCASILCVLFCFDHTATTEIYPLSLHDALPIFPRPLHRVAVGGGDDGALIRDDRHLISGLFDADGSIGHVGAGQTAARDRAGDRKSTRLNSSHVKISYAVFCLKKKRGRTYARGR